jgi:hypothetical protein
VIFETEMLLDTKNYLKNKPAFNISVIRSFLHGIIFFPAGMLKKLLMQESLVSVEFGYSFDSRFTSQIYIRLVFDVRKVFVSV